MGRSTDYSRPSRSIRRTKLWDPIETLGVINTDQGYYGITCVGHAPSQKRRCRVAIRRDNIELIIKTMDEISYLHPSSPTVISRLRRISGPALCVRFHQGQAQTIMMQWQTKIEQLKDQVGVRKFETSNRVSRKQDYGVGDLQKQMREVKELLASLQQEIDSERRGGQNSGGRARKPEREQRETEDLERERLEKARLRERRLKKERIDKEQLEKERIEKERLETERREEERQEKVRKEIEEAQRRQQAEQNERNRTRAQKLRAERERENREKEQKEQEEWDQSWTRYQEQWVEFRSSPPTSRQGDIQDHIPWPVKSGLYSEVTRPKVEEFFQKAVPRDGDMRRLWRRICLKWHPHSLLYSLGENEPNEAVKIMLDFICREMTGMINAGKSADPID